MPKETVRKTEVTIIPSANGVEVTAQNTITFTEITTESYSSVDKAIDVKETEANVKQALGVVIRLFGYSSFLGAAIPLGARLWQHDTYEMISGTGLNVAAGYLLLKWGDTLCRGGDLARDQWTKLKEILNNAGQPVGQDQG